MKIGVFLAYRPNEKLTSEGLGRQLAYLIGGLAKLDCKITIAAPKWSIDNLIELFDDCNVNSENIEYLTTDMPISLNLYYIFLRKFYIKRRKRKQEGYFKKALLNLIETFMSILLTNANILIFLILSLIIFSFLLLIFPLVAIIFASKYFIRVLNIIKIEKKLLNFIDKIKVKLINFLKDVFNRKIYEFEIKKLIHIINKKNDVDIWYSPTIFWDKFNDINGIKVLCVPDLVINDFPLFFSNSRILADKSNIYCNLISNSKYFITYSNYIKNTLLIKKFLIEKKHIKVIPHGTNNLKDFIDVESNLRYKQLNGQSNKIFARSKIQEYANIHFSRDKYLSSFDFSDVKYIFYASQNRPYKNILNLIKAYEYLLREKFIPIKLFLTCDFSHYDKVENYIYKNRLQYDVISFKNCSSQTLAALYMCAELAVNPTLFEGGFPFTFIEAMSVGTPVLLSKIPQVEEVLEEYDSNEFLFNPYDYKDIANKIMFGLNNREYLFSKQKPIFEKMSLRTWDVAAKDYKKAFEYFVNLEKESN